MGAALNRTVPLTACRFKFSRFALVPLLLLIWVIPGCLSLRIDRVNSGIEVPRPTADLEAGKATLGEVLARYGAPTEVVDLKGRFVLFYRKSFYHGGQFTLGIPLSDVASGGSTLRMDAAGNLLRHDLLALFFTPDGILSETKYERGADRPFWGTFWR